MQSLTLTRLAVRPQPAARGTLAVEAADGVAAVALAAALVPLTLIHVWEGEEEKDKDVNGHILKLISLALVSLVGEKNPVALNGVWSITS